jgi:hypothetical protein
VSADPDRQLLDELHTHLAEHTPGCNAYVDALLKRSADTIARLTEQDPK